MRNKGNIVQEISKYLVNGVTTTDYFGAPISLNYKGRSTYKTFLGGLITILIGRILFE